MKTYLALIIFAVAALSASAADPVVVIQNAGSVTVDGVPMGTVVDVLVNSKAPNIRAVVLDAWIALEQKVKDAERTRADAVIAKNTDDTTKAQADAKVAKDAATAKAAADVKAAQDDAAAKIAAADAKAADAKAKSDAACTQYLAVVNAVKALPNLASLPAAVQTAVQAEDAKRKAAIATQKAALDAELAKIP